MKTAIIIAYIACAVIFSIISMTLMIEQGDPDNDDVIGLFGFILGALWPLSALITALLKIGEQLVRFLRKRAGRR